MEPNGSTGELQHICPENEAWQTTVIEDWPDPDWTLLDQPLPSVPVVSLAGLGRLGAWVDQTAKGKAVAPDPVLLNLLVIASGVVGAKRRVRVHRNWTEPCILWGAHVAPPSEGKSGASYPFETAVRAVEQGRMHAYETQLRDYEAQKLVAKTCRENWEQAVQKAAADNVLPPPMPEVAMEPRKPTPPILWLSDTTTERAAQIMEEHPGGLIVRRDELAGWIGGFDRYAKSTGGDRAFWLEAWDGRSFRATRKLGDISVQFNAASILGGMQPDRLAPLLRHDADDGLISRFLFVWPDPLLPGPIKESAACEADIIPILRRLDGLPFARDKHDRPVRIDVPLSREAFERFSQWRETTMAVGREASGLHASWWGKSYGKVLRIALVLELLFWAERPVGDEPAEVTLDTVELAIELFDDWLLPQANRVFRLATPKPEDAATQLLAKWILKRRPQRFNASSLRRDPDPTAPSMSGQQMDRACKELLDAGWIRPARRRTGRAGRPPKDFYVHPLILLYGAPG